MPEQLLSVANGMENLGLKMERRAWVRFAKSQDVWCRAIAILKPNIGWFGSLSNLSAGGVALRMKRRLKPGTLLVIQFEGNEERRSFAVQVAHATAGNRHWMIGCKFLSTLDEAQVRTLLGQ